METAGLRELPAGTMLDDKYRIERLLAVGGMGAVYEGTHIKLRKRVAIKILNPQLSSPPMIERFHREAITASQIGHEGIAQVTDLGTSSAGEPFLVMEYLEGESLANRLRTTGPMPVEVACELGCAILSPLAAAHAAGIVHRDLKPDNVFLVRQSRGEMVKLLDFGISRAAGLEGEFRLTTTGLVLGTPFYMSPEQARGDSEVGPSADLYAFGVILYEMLAGRVPIQGENYNQLMYRVMSGDYVPPSRMRPDLPPSLEQIILATMALTPDQRPRSASDLEQYLLPFCRATFRAHNERTSGPRLGSTSPGQPGSPRSMGSFMPDPSTDRTVLASPSSVYGPGATGAPGSSGSPAGLGLSRAETTPAPSPASARPRSSRIWLVLGLLVVLGAGVAAAVMIAGQGAGQDASDTHPERTPGSAIASSLPASPDAAVRGSGATVTSVAIDAAGAATVAIDAAPAAEVVAVAPPPTMVTLRFAVEPATAVVTVDGKLVNNGELVVAKDAASHTLHIAAPGHTPHDEAIHFDESQRLEVQLKRSARGATDPHAHPGTTSPRPDRIDSQSPYH